jgi:alkaline phosphatase
MEKIFRFSLWGILIGISSFSFAQKIHSHNDYKQVRPFWDAYLSGANSIEADVFLQDGKLSVAHLKSEIDFINTLEKLYLEPLNQIVKSNKRQSLQILIDIKSAYEPTLEAIIKAISNYPKLAKAHKKNKKILFVISGNRPSISYYSQYPAFIYFDHQSLLDLENSKNHKIALVSFSFLKFSNWKGNGNMDEDEKLKLKAVIDSVQASGYPVRFWGTPDTPTAWETLNALNVDFINTDKPKSCKQYFEKKFAINQF